MTPIPEDPVPQPRPSERSTVGDVSTTRAILESELDDVDRRLERAQTRYRRHVMWMILGLSPSAVVPALLAFSEWGGGALVALVLVVCTAESVRALRARTEIKRLRRDRLGIVEQLEGIPASPVPHDRLPHGGPD